MRGDTYGETEKNEEENVSLLMYYFHKKEGRGKVCPMRR